MKVADIWIFLFRSTAAQVRTESSASIDRRVGRIEKKLFIFFWDVVLLQRKLHPFADKCWSRDGQADLGQRRFPTLPPWNFRMKMQSSDWAKFKLLKD